MARLGGLFIFNNGLFFHIFVITTCVRESKLNRSTLCWYYTVCVEQVDSKMDPLSALSLAGNIVQFIEFVCKLVSNTREIYRSSSTTKDLGHIDGIYERLVFFGAQLSHQDKTQSQDTAPSSVSAHYDALEELLERCKRECNVLLGLTGKIKATKLPGDVYRSAFKMQCLKCGTKMK